MDVLHESVRESTAQDSSKSVSVSEPVVTLPQRTWYVTSPPKSKTLATMTRFFGPVGSAASGAEKGLVTLTTHFRASVEGKLMQLQQSKTAGIETITDPKYAESVGSLGKFSCPKNCAFATSHGPVMATHLKAGKCQPSQRVIDCHTVPNNQTGPPAGCISSASVGAVRTSPVAPTPAATAKNVLPTEGAGVGQKRKKDGSGLKTSFVTV